MTTVHFLNPFSDATGGSEWRAASLFQALADFGEVSLWSTGQPHKDFVGRFPIRKVDPMLRHFPNSGTLVFAGIYFGIPEWLRHGEFERIVLIHNLSSSEGVRAVVDRIKSLSKTPIEVVCACQALEVELDGLDVVCAGVQPSWIDIERFQPRATTPDRTFTIGRMNRDYAKKFHDGDPMLYRRLGDEGFRIRIMGGTSLREAIGDRADIELLPAGAESAEAFLNSLDAMIYRTADDWFETFGRSIIEGMACGVVPVAYYHGGYADYIDHGVDGVLYRADDEAVDWLHRLRADPALRSTMSFAARARTEELYGEESRQRVADFYFRGVRP